MKPRTKILRTTTIVASALTLLFVPSLVAQEGNRTDLVIADFESESYGDWKVEGVAFGKGPAKGTLPGQMNVEGFLGSGLVNSFNGGDNSIGSLTSPPFKIERSYLQFLIGGGGWEKETCMNLIVEGKVIRSASGPNTKDGGSETLERSGWDVRECMGKEGVIEIIDQRKGGWGHINVDHIVQTDIKPKGLVKDAERQILANARYLHLPIKNGARKCVVSLLVDGKEVVRNDIEMADGEADWWAPMDIEIWKGSSITLRVDKMPEDSTALSSVTQSDTIKDDEKLYQESMRGQFHFSPRRGWNNDPNGMVYYRGEYHLFFQHNPYGWGWGNMHWGHAVSKDMVHWDELGDKLLPDSMGPMFSGSAVVDWNNTSGFGKDGEPPLVLIYTAAGNPTVQGIAYSNDGRNFTKYSGNPVLKQITGGNRDPKVIWHAPTKKWVMVLYVALAGGKHTIHFFDSPNLRDWKQISTTEGVTGTPYLFECPDFFELPVDGIKDQKKWVLLGANSEYAVGTFDGTRFQSEHGKLTGHRGRGFYAPQTFSDIPEKDGRRVQIGWFQTETKGMPFNQSMTIPLELKLISTKEGPRMTFTPVKELESLRAATNALDARILKPGDGNPLEKIRAELIELRAEIEPQDASEIVFRVRDATILYDPKKEELSVNGNRVPAPLRDGNLRITVYCDRTGLEVFASDGLLYVPLPMNMKPESQSLHLETRGGPAKLKSLEVYELRSMWRRP